MDCPSCHKDIEISEQNYGALFACPECQAVYFINFDGQPEYSEQDGSQQEVGQQVGQDLSEQNPPPLESGMQENFVEGLPDLPQNEIPNEMLYQLNNPFDMPSENSGQSPEKFSDVAQSISNFGNSESQIATLNYDLKISGLDSKEIMLAFKEAIQDSKFGWETSDIMKKIKTGELVLEKLNPAAAFILARRLRFLGLNLKWKQNVLQ